MCVCVCVCVRVCVCGVCVVCMCVCVGMLPVQWRNAVGVPVSYDEVTQLIFTTIFPLLGTKTTSFSHIKTKWDSCSCWA